MTIEAARDFDMVILGTPVQTLPFLCAEPQRWSDRWRQMMTEVKAVQTLSFQVWMSKDIEKLGWTGPTLPLLSLFVQPYNTWSDMSQTLPRETWPAGHAPHSVNYFTGAQPGPDMPAPASDHDFPVRMRAAAREGALLFLKKHLTTLLPRAVSATAPPAIDWDLLVATGPQREGEAHFETQYWRSNCDHPHERLHAGVTGHGKFRMRADDTGLSNLTIAGDWIDNGMHVACLEGAVMGGILAACAVAGVKFPIVGEMLNGSIFGMRRSRCSCSFVAHYGEPTEMDQWPAADPDPLTNASSAETVTLSLSYLGAWLRRVCESCRRGPASLATASPMLGADDAVSNRLA